MTFGQSCDSVTVTWTMSQWCDRPPGGAASHFQDTEIIKCNVLRYIQYIIKLIFDTIKLDMLTLKMHLYNDNRLWDLKSCLILNTPRSQKDAKSLNAHFIMKAAHMHPNLHRDILQTDSCLFGTLLFECDFSLGSQRGTNSLKRVWISVAQKDEFFLPILR